jgi:Arc/MetJ-type ribon-helix-helix transcriptional regulator
VPELPPENAGDKIKADMSDIVKATVRCGEYATEGEVIRDGMRAPMAQHCADIMQTRIRFR